MKTKEFINRFNSLCSSQFDEPIGIPKKIFYFLSWLRAFIIHGASFNDFFVYKFFLLNHIGKKQFITFRKHKELQSICNPNKEDIEVCRNKAQFYRFFNEELGRKWLDLKKASKEEIIDFLTKAKSNNSALFIKEVYGFRGSGVGKLTNEQYNYDHIQGILEKNPECHYIIEEGITQEGPLKEFHPWSINTIRIVTVYDDKKDIVHLMDASLRVGNNKRFVDNLHFGGIAADIDFETGMILSKGFDSNKTFYVKHPITGVQFIGFKIPYWKECIEYVKQMARKLPTVRYVGWDIVSKGDGTFCLIEANDNADHDIQQIPLGPLWNKYKSILKDIK